MMMVSISVGMPETNASATYHPHAHTHTQISVFATQFYFLEQTNKQTYDVKSPKLYTSVQNFHQVKKILSQA